MLKVLSAIALAVIAPSALALEKLSIQETIRQAVERHPNVRGAKADYEASRATLQAAVFQRFPSITLGLGQSLPEGGIERPSTSIRVDQPIYSFGRISAQISRSDADTEVRSASVQVASREIALATASTYIDVLRLQERERLSEQNLVRHRALYNSIERRAQAQVSPESDLLLTASRLAQAETELDQLRSARDRATRILSEFLQRDRIAIQQIQAPPQPILPKSIEEVLLVAEQVSPELDRLEASERVARADLELTRAQSLPTFYARYERKFGALDFFTAREQTSLAIDFTSGAGLSSIYSTRAARLKLVAAEEGVISIKRSIRDRLIPIWVNLTGLTSQLPIAVRYAESAQGVAESFERQFAIGRKSWLDVLNAQREAAQSEQTVAELRWSMLALSYQILLETDPSSYSPSPGTRQ